MFDVIFIIAQIFIVLVFVVTISMIISPKLRGKMMGRQIKSMQYMLEENEDILTDIAHKGAKIQNIGIKSAAKAIKEGLTETESIYCKHCGSEIDNDSKFCKRCGKEQ